MIYFIQAGKNGPIKIGYTDNDVQSRLQQLQTACPYELKLLWCFNGDVEDEKDIHFLFDYERVRGEWFHPSRKLLDYMEKDTYNTVNIFCGNNKYEIKERMYDIIIEKTSGIKQDWSVQEAKKGGRLNFYNWRKPDNSPQRLRNGEK